MVKRGEEYLDMGPNLVLLNINDKQRYEIGKALAILREHKIIKVKKWFLSWLLEHTWYCFV